MRAGMTVRVFHFFSTPALSSSSEGVRAIDGWKMPSGSCFSPSRLPLMPANFSTYAYQGSRSL